MAMRKEPERRYVSVEQLSEDLRRYLEGRPVQAREDKLIYRAGKFVRRNKLAVSAAILVAPSLLGGIAATAFQARRAERRFEQVRKLANTFLFEIHDRIESLSGSTETRELLVKTALEYLDSLAQEATGDPALQLELANAYLRVGNVQGDLTTANLGQVDAAGASYRKALTLALAARDENNTEYWRVLCETYLSLGQQSNEAGRLTEGIDLLQRGLAAAQQANERKPGRLTELMLLIRLHERLGDLELKARKIPVALDHYRQTLKYVEQRAAQFPGKAARANLALIHSRVGDAQAETGDLTGALASYQKSVAIHESLVRENPSNATLRRELKVAYNWLGNFLGNPSFINQGDKTSALGYYRKGLTISEELVAADPKNVLARVDLAISYGKVGDVLTETDPAQAAEHYRQAIAITRELLEQSPKEFRYLRRQAGFIRGLATALRESGDRPGALQKLRPLLGTLRETDAANPANAEVKAQLHATLLSLSGLLSDTGDHETALELSRQALALSEAAAAANPVDLYARWRLADSYAGLARYHETLASNRKAAMADRLAAWREARDWRQKSLDQWDGWSRQATSGVFNETRREQAARLLARCNAELNRLKAKP